MNFLQRGQLGIAVSAPASAIEDDHKRAGAEQIFRVPEHAVAIGKSKARSRIADLERTLRDPGMRELLGRAIYDCQAFGRDHGAKLGGEGVELSLETHVKDSALFSEIPKRSEGTLCYEKI